MQSVMIFGIIIIKSDNPDSKRICEQICVENISFFNVTIICSVLWIDSNHFVKLGKCCFFYSMENSWTFDIVFDVQSTIQLR